MRSDGVHYIRLVRLARLGIDGATLSSLPAGLGAAIFLVQVAIGVILFATFQEFVPNELGARDAWSGYLLGAYGLSRFVFETPSGAISDRIERKLGLLVGFASMLPAIVLMATVQRVEAYLLFSAMLGVGTAFLWPAAYAISADLYEHHQRGKVIGFLNLCQLLGFGTGALSGALVVESQPGVMFVIALVAISSAWICVLVFVPAHRSGKLFGLIEHTRRPSVWSIMTVRLAALSGLILAATAALAMVVPAIRPYGEDVLDRSFASLTLALTPALVLGALCFIPAGHMADRVGRSIPFIIGQALVVAGLLGVAATESLVLAVAGAFLVFVGNVFSVPAWNAAIMDLAPETHRGTLIGLTVAISGLGLAIGPFVGGQITDQYGAPTTFRVAAGICATVGVAIWLYARAYGDHGRIVVEEVVAPAGPP